MRWVLLAVIVLLVAIVFDLGLMVYAAYIAVALLMAARWITRQWTDRLVTRRECSHDEARIGDVVQVSNEVVNEGRLPISWVLLEDVLPPDTQLFVPHRLEVEGERVSVCRLGAGRSHRVSYSLKCNRRGYYQIGPLLAETGDLFGLFRRFKVAADPNFLLVLPKPVELQSYDIASRRPFGEIRLTHRLFEDPTRIAGVRRYERGDALNRVHWRATARTGQLHSKVYEPSAMSGATILLDFHEASYARKHEPFRSELAITAAASLANAVYQLGQQIGLITNGRDAVDRIREEGWRGQTRSRDQARDAVSMRASSDRLRPMVVPTRRGIDQFLEIQRALGRVELTDGMRFADLVLETEPRMPRDASVLAIVPMVDDSVAVTLGSLARQGYAVTAVINAYDYDVFARAAGPLIAQGITALHLRDEPMLTAICERQLSGR